LVEETGISGKTTQLPHVFDKLYHYKSPVFMTKDNRKNNMKCSQFNTHKTS
jgi:hypothetical protein